MKWLIERLAMLWEFARTGDWPLPAKPPTPVKPPDSKETPVEALVAECLDMLRKLPLLDDHPDMSVLAIHRTWKFLVVAKLQVAVDMLKEGRGDELARLQRFEQATRNVLGTPYGIIKATWNKPDGTPQMIRELDEDAVMSLLNGEL